MPNPLFLPLLLDQQRIFDKGRQQLIFSMAFHPISGDTQSRQKPAMQPPIADRISAA